MELKINETITYYLNFIKRVTFLVLINIEKFTNKVKLFLATR